MKNSLLVMVASVITSATGFIFWILCARFFDNETVGIGVGLISAITFITMLSKVGFDQAAIRFLPEGEKDSIVSTSILVTFLTTLGIGAIFVVGIDLWSPGLGIIKDHSAEFISILMASAMVAMVGTVFIADRRPDLYLYQNTLLSLRIPFLVLLSLGALGILYSFGIATAIALAVSLVMLLRSGIRFGRVSSGFFKEAIRYSLGTYIASMLFSLPAVLLPILVLDNLGASAAAYFYIAYQIASVIYLVSSATSTTLLIEGSHGEPLSVWVPRSLKITYALMVLPVVGVLLFGEWALSIFGDEYAASAYGLLVCMAISSFSIAIVHMYFSIKLVQKRLKAIIAAGTLLSTCIIVLSYVLPMMFGYMGVGYAWLVGYAIVSLVMVYDLWSDGLLSGKEEGHVRNEDRPRVPSK